MPPPPTSVSKISWVLGVDVCRRPAAAGNPPQEAARNPSKPPPSPGGRQTKRSYCLLGLVGENVVGVLDLLELGLGLFVARIAVGVILTGKGAVGFLDLVVRRLFGDAENFIMVAWHFRFRR